MKLNYHHLYYFWQVAKSGHLTRTAEALHVSQSSLSQQIRQLEERLGQALFIREGRQLHLSEAGRLAFDYADAIFTQGEELSALFAEGGHAHREVVRVGAVATLSRNFQEEFVRPLLGRDDLDLILQSGGMDDLLRRLSAHKLDVVLSNQPVRGDSEHPWRSQRLARQPVSLIASPDLSPLPEFPKALSGHAFILPGAENASRHAFDQLCSHYRLSPKIAAEVDDMAMMRLLARDTQHIAVMPPVVVRDELHNGTLKDYGALPGVWEEFYAITIQRRFESPSLKALLKRPGEALLV
ncbi:LysR substrate-binding domain-containing protein [Halomonas vilamensis]|uniref:LysR substrate-binding domain-containing protein n=1 Tax=Vreelandella vilamensis TaxID=531309 RepID=A0ABU1H2H6_9GAMM|nr:LysR substrate-binding domain-containing protein [Halomonas vilamensis]MDR5898500.1 LysR substrate-binding domain-containing protein [Halomonas vilamensis]